MQITVGHKKLRAWLAGEGRSQTALAKTLGVTQSAVALWIKGGHRPSAAMQSALAKLGICEPADWLTKKERSKLEAIAGGAQ